MWICQFDAEGQAPLCDCVRVALSGLVRDR